MLARIANFNIGSLLSDTGPFYGTNSWPKDQLAQKTPDETQIIPDGNKFSVWLHRGLVE